MSSEALTPERFAPNTARLSSTSSPSTTGGGRIAARVVQHRVARQPRRYARSSIKPSGAVGARQLTSHRLSYKWRGMSVSWLPFGRQTGHARSLLCGNGHCAFLWRPVKVGKLPPLRGKLSTSSPNGLRRRMFVQHGPRHLFQIDRKGFWCFSNCRGGAVTGSNRESLGQDKPRTAGESGQSVSVLNAFTTTLQIAFEAVVFPNRFEIDEQEPLSRLEALTEQLLHGADSLLSSGRSDADEVACRAATISSFPRHPSVFAPRSNATNG